MTKKVLIIMDPLESINIKKDTTYQLIISAQEVGHKVYYLKPETLSINSMGPTGKIYEVEVNNKESKHDKSAFILKVGKVYIQYMSIINIHI